MSSVVNLAIAYLEAIGLTGPLDGRVRILDFSRRLALLDAKYPDIGRYRVCEAGTRRVVQSFRFLEQAQSAVADLSARPENYSKGFYFESVIEGPHWKAAAYDADFAAAVRVVMEADTAQLPVDPQFKSVLAFLAKTLNMTVQELLSGGGSLAQDEVATTESGQQDADESKPPASVPVPVKYDGNPMLEHIGRLLGLRDVPRKELAERVVKEVRLLKSKAAMLELPEASAQLFGEEAAKRRYEAARKTGLSHAESADEGWPEKARDPVHEEAGQWYFWDETWADKQGPFKTEGEARKALRDYCLMLDGDKAELYGPLLDLVRRMLARNSIAGADSLSRGDLVAMAGVMADKYEADIRRLKACVNFLYSLKHSGLNRVMSTFAPPVLEFDLASRRTYEAYCADYVAKADKELRAAAIEALGVESSLQSRAPNTAGSDATVKGNPKGPLDPRVECDLSDQPNIGDIQSPPIGDVRRKLAGE